MGFSKRTMEHERAAARREAEARAAEARRPQLEIARKIIGIWNGRLARGAELWFHPTIGAAIAAGLPVLRFVCTGCGIEGTVDLRTIDRHRGATIESLIPSLSCRRCQPHPPFARLLGLSAAVSTARFTKRRTK